MFFREGVMFFIEFKATGKTATPLQKYQMSLLMAHGFRCFVVDSIELGLEVLEEMG
jgi:hypothetical protein